MKAEIGEMHTRNVTNFQSKYSKVERSDGISQEIGDEKANQTVDGDVVTIDLYGMTENPLKDDDVEMSPNSSSRCFNSSCPHLSQDEDEQSFNYSKHTLMEKNTCGKKTSLTRVCWPL